MALVKYGPTVVQMSGSVAGVTYARNRFGNYTRPRTKPVNPKSARQVARRTLLMFLAEQWREAPMDDAKRLAWKVYADSISWNNRLGEAITLTGYNAFIQCNSVRELCFAGYAADGPAALGLPAGDPLFAISAMSAAAQTFTVTFSDNFDWCDEATGALVIDLGQPQNPSRTFFGGPWRFNHHIPGNVGAPPASPLAAQAQDSWTFTEGQIIWPRASILREDGRVSTKFATGPVLVGA